MHGTLLSETSLLLQPVLCSQHLFLRNEKYLQQNGKTALEPILPVFQDSPSTETPRLTTTPPRGKIYPFRQCLEAPKSKAVL